MRRNCYCWAPLKVPTSTLSSATPISKRELAIWRSHDVFKCFSTVQIKNQSYIYFQFIWPNDLAHVLHRHMLRSFSLGFYQAWSQSTYPLLTYNVFIADTLRHAVTLILDHLTLNVCSVSAFTLSNYVLAKSNNPRWISSVDIENLGTDHHLGF